MATLRVAIDASRARAGAAQARTALRTVGASATQAGGRIRKFDASLAGAGRTSGLVSRQLRQLLGGFTALIAIRSTINVLRSFGETMAFVRAIAVDVNDTLADQTRTFARLEEVTRGLGATTRFTATQAAEGMLALSRAGFDANEAIAALPLTLALATAGMLDLGSASDLVAVTLRQFGLAAEETERVADVLLNTANNSTTTVAELGESMKFAGAFAGQLGISLEETAAAMGIMANAGLRGSLAGTALRQILVGLIKPTKQSRDQIAALGLTMADVNVQTLGVVEVFQRLAKAGAGPAQLARIFRVTAVTGAAALISAADAFKDFSESIVTVQGTAQRTADIVDDTLNGAILQLKSAVESVQLSMTGFNDSLRDVIEFATLVARTFDDISDSSQGVTRSATLVGAAIRGIVTVVTVLLALKLIGWLVAARFGFTALFSAIAAHPFGAITAAVVLLIVQLAKLRDELDQTQKRAGITARIINDSFADLDKNLKVIVDTFKELQRSGVFGEKFNPFTVDEVALATLLGAQGEISAALKLQERLVGKTQQQQDRLIFQAETLASLRAAANRDLERQNAFVVQQAKNVKRVADALEKAEKAADAVRLAQLLPGIAERAKGRLRILQRQLQVEKDRLATMKDQLAVGTENLPADIERRAQVLLRERDAVVEFDKSTRSIVETFLAERAVRTELTAERESGLEAMRGELSLIGLTSEARQRAIFLREAESSAATEFRTNTVGANAAIAEQLDLFDRLADSRSAALAVAKELADSRRAALAMAREEAAAQVAVQVATQTFEKQFQALRDLRDGFGRTADEQERFIEGQRIGALAAAAFGEGTDEAAEAVRKFLALFDEVQKLQEFKVFADEIGDAFSDAAGQMLDGFVAATRESENAADAFKKFGEVAVQALEDFIRALIRAIIQQALLTPLSNAISGGILGLFNADGNVFQGGRQMQTFASGGVITSPAVFPMANGGIGLAGEAGPEGILPLRRGADGKLGVIAQGGGGGATNITQNFTINTPDANSFRKSQAQIASSARRQLGRST